MRIRVTRSARKHKIGNAHILAAMRAAGEPIGVPGTDRLVYVGLDDRGVELVVIAVPDNRDPAGLAVIHAMPTAFGSEKE
jgi:transcriptional/translational regulatory protein YebC/TACO1